MNDLFYGFEFIHSYIDDLLILPKGYHTNQVQKLELNINRLKGKIIEYNVEIISLDKPKWDILVFG